MALMESGPAHESGEASPPWERRQFRRGPRETRYLVLKRVFDLTAAGLLLAGFFPVFLLIAAAILLDDRGPVLYRQIRVGKGGRLFPFFKFRTMRNGADAMKAGLAARNEADGPLFKMREDPRVTRVGRWLRRYSLDELPQLLSVVRGDMSLVGPRPHLPSEAAFYTLRQRQRLRAQPGMLCLREVSGRSALSFERWIELDLLYLQYRSLGADLNILLRAIPVVVRGEGAY